MKAREESTGRRGVSERRVITRMRRENKEEVKRGRDEWDIRGGSRAERKKNVGEREMM